MKASRKHALRYPNYRDSGVEWLGQIPSHWYLKRLKHTVARFESGGTPESDNPSYWTEEEHGTPWVAISDMTRAFHVRETARRVTEEGRLSKNLQVLPAGTLLYSMYASLGKVALLETAAVINQAILGIVFRPSIALRDYMRWWFEFMQAQVHTLSSSNTQDNLSAERVRNMPVVLPASVEEQSAISDFLASETAKVDALATMKARLIQLLRKKRTALITRTVTRGLDTSVPMKDSGVEWLGEIPQHWEVKRLWHLTPSGRRIMYGIVLPGPNVDEGVPIVKGGDVVASRLKPESLSKTAFEIEAQHARSRLKGGDLVYAIRGSIGDAALVPEELNGANLTQDAARVACTPATHGRWLLYTLQSRSVFSQLEAGALGATIKGINIRDLKRALIPVPPKCEQEQIASFLDTETALFDTLSARVHQAIDHLKELRIALISAAVTGKIDVRKTTPQ